MHTSIKNTDSLKSPKALTLTRRLGVLVIVLLSLAIPPFLNYSGTNIFLTICFYTLIVAGLALLLGYAGQLSLGQGAFFAIGAYSAGLFAVNGVDPLIALISAPLLAGLVALLMGLPIMKLKGHYLAFATIALQLIILAFLRVTPATGGDIGLVGIPSLSVGGIVIEGLSLVYLSLVIVIVVLFLCRNLIASGPGRGLRALADREMAAMSTGVPVTRYKIIIFCISAAFAGLAGGLMAFYYGAVSPDSFSVLLSFELVIMAIFGGLGSVAGPVIGVVLITGLTQALNSIGALPGLPEATPAILTYLVFGALLASVISFLPRGLWPLLSKLGWLVLRGFGVKSP